jgi:hypothetical protein
MTGKERVHAALEGRPVDRPPATSLYNYLYHCDHFSELTGRPPWELWKWKYAEEERENLELVEGLSGLHRQPYHPSHPPGPGAPVPRVGENPLVGARRGLAPPEKIPAAC